MDDHDEIEGFSDEEIAEQIAPYLAEVDADYKEAFEALLPVFEAKGPSE